MEPPLPMYKCQQNTASCDPNIQPRDERQSERQICHILLQGGQDINPDSAGKSWPSWMNPRACHTLVQMEQSSPSMFLFIRRSKPNPTATGTPQQSVPPFLYKTSPHLHPTLHLSQIISFSVHPLSILFYNREEMFLRSVSAVSLPTLQGESYSPFLGSSVLSSSRLSSSSFLTSTSALRFPLRRCGNGLVVSASLETDNKPALTGIVFQPFEEVKKDAFVVPIAPQFSLARQNYKEECEAAINEQINVEYTVSYAYHAMYAYFDRDNVALNGLAKFYKESSEEEREHAEKLMEYQNKRGGRVKLHTILPPPSEFDHAEKGDALYSMELALSLEKLTNEKLLHLHSVADRNNDPQMTEFIEREFLSEQVEAIKKIAGYVAQLRRVGKGHGTNQISKFSLHLQFFIHSTTTITCCLYNLATNASSPLFFLSFLGSTKTNFFRVLAGVWHFDQMLLHEGDAA
ncbi:hypothetical protein L1049_009486 [Liquidambar formosana]|uniref:Ferritin n=1 Tax=Liquidambar formosana TaxID=63359 RepID=A0AAP0X557_LIQFO